MEPGHVFSFAFAASKRGLLDAADFGGVERDLGLCEPDTLYRETAKRFGYKSLSPKARARLESVRRF